MFTDDTFYAVSVVTSVTEEAAGWVNGWTRTRQLPTFYLSARTQGIVSEAHAERIARAIVGADASITAVRVHGEG